MTRTKPPVANSVRTANWIMSAASGSHVWDQHGNRYLDLTSGWNVVNAGWNNQEILLDWQECMTSMPFRPSRCTDKYREALTSELTMIAPGYLPLYACTGSEGIDHALKIARLVTGRAGVASFCGAFHGSTTGCALAAGTEVPHLSAFPPGERSVTLPFPVDDAALLEIERLLRAADHLGALVFETVTTNAGSAVVPDAFLRLARQLSRELGFLLVCDEVGTGINRTGALLSTLERDLRPDLIVWGKALTNGLYPLSVTLFLPDFMTFIDEASFGSTFGGSSAGCAAALATLKYHARHQLGARARANGDALRSHLARNMAGSRSVERIEGRGLELAVHLDWEALAPRIDGPATLMRRMKEQSLFAVLCPPEDHIMLMPPLTTPLPELTHACDLICELICG